MLRVTLVEHDEQAKEGLTGHGIGVGVVGGIVDKLM